MADHGLYCENDGAHVQIDSEYRNFALWDQGLVNVNQESLSPCWEWDRFVAVIPFDYAVPRPPLIAVTLNVGDSAALIGYGHDSNGDVVEARVATQSTKTLINYHLYLPFEDLPPPEDGWGMKVWDDESGLVFHSNATYMRIMDILAGSPSDHGPFSHTTLDEPYYVLGGFGGWWASSDEYVLAVTRTDTAECKLEYLPPYNLNLITGCLFETGYEWDTQTILVVRDVT